jgi:hypothetical protein
MILSRDFCRLPAAAHLYGQSTAEFSDGEITRMSRIIGGDGKAGHFGAIATAWA